ncbi:unnamed protein product [Candidula unifasciata]|uniref:Noggin n=1 Tax=Candidula unifasciata TaxID=100452 RepID=A0A8S3YIQ7_9EUPU|nr:unnamed protein product [Candidula unifasciata]
MQLASLLLVLAVRLCSCGMLDSHASKFYFQLLQSTGKDYLPERHGSNGQRQPVPSDHLPLVNLVEDDDDARDPRPSDINVTQLRQQLGSEFDREFMSLEAPRRRVDKLHLQFLNGKPKGRRPPFLRLLRSARLQDGSRLTLNLPRNERRRLQKFVWNLTFCPVRYSWKFLGRRVWPQWIKEGSCFSTRSCSIPPGMTCQQRAQTYKTFLRWHCENFERRQHCRWIEFLYPIITECSCSC